MEFHQIRYFLAVCDHGSFTRAAEFSYVSQPSLTHAIKKLEMELVSARKLTIQINNNGLRLIPAKKIRGNLK